MSRTSDVAWPRDIEDDYERVRPLGEGAFGVVWLARAKADRPETAIDGDEDGDVPPLYVAIKRIHASEDGERKYADREIAILSELRHPNVVRCLKSTEVPSSRIVVLTLADGPNLGKMVEGGGALGVGLARLAARHLISAVAYLHGRGVIHRDIKPDNCILTRAHASGHTQSNKDDWMANDAFWDDKATSDGWKVVLVDFGFARALAPKDVAKTMDRKSSVRDMVQRGIEQQKSQRASLANLGHGAGGAPVQKGKSFRGMSLKRGRSLKNHMSALGSGDYAAPEVRRAVPKSEADEALSSHVADYGLIADAYSVGVTIRVLLTGVPPNENEMDFMSSQNNLLLTILSAICGRKTEGGRRKRYKFLDESPRAARELVARLTRPNYEDRLTVPLARDEVWIKGGMGADDPVVTLPTGDVPAGNDDPIKCLDCATWKF